MYFYTKQFDNVNRSDTQPPKQLFGCNIEHQLYKGFVVHKAYVVTQRHEYMANPLSTLRTFEYITYLRLDVRCKGKHKCKDV